MLVAHNATTERRAVKKIKIQLRQFKENERLRAALRFACGATVALVPFYLFARAAAAWTPHPVFFPDDAFYARLCLPSGLRLYWHDFGLYRILTILPYALVNRALMRNGVSPALVSFVAFACATLVFVWSCVRAGLGGRRAALLAGVLLGSPVLLETVNFWSGTLNYALVLLLVAAHLRACVWAHASASEPAEKFEGRAKRGLLVTAGGALLALLTYEIALPFVLATSALYVRGWWRRAAACGVAFIAALAFVGALAATGLYWPQRFKLVTEKLNGAVVTGTATGEQDSANASATDASTTDASTAEGSATSGSMTNRGATDGGATDGSATGGSATSGSATGGSATRGNERVRGFGASRLSVSGRARMYLSLLLSFAATTVRGSLWFWAFVPALLGLSFLARRRRGESGAETTLGAAGILPCGVVAFAFAVALAACASYLALTKSMNARYAAFLLIYGAAMLAWTRGRVAACALASLVVLQVLVAAALPVHLRDVEQVMKEQAAASFTEGSDLISVDGRLARASWGRRFLDPPADDALTRPLNPRACRYAVPCEECK
ncbi:MAG TPA: hypothetical protein VF656_18380 [Pyrinomonadaceae bacterium]